MISEIFLFGSSLESPSPNDIDIVIIYDPSQLQDYESLQKLREEISSKVWEEFRLPTDVIFLNELEYRVSSYAGLNKKSILSQV